VKKRRIVMSGFGDQDQYDGLGLAELVRRSKVQPSELIEEAIRRVEAVNPRVNAGIHKMYDLAWGEPSKGFHSC
jgi:amidase